jgi:hypothetical protein
MSVKFDLVEHGNSYHDNHWAIQVKEGAYEGVVFQYDTVSMKEEEGELVITYNTITLDNPDNLDLKTDEFEGIMGEILTELIENHLKELDNDDGTTDTTEPNTQ